MQGSAGVSAFPLTFVSSPLLTSSPRNAPAVATTNSNWRTEKVLPYLEVRQGFSMGPFNYVLNIQAKETLLTPNIALIEEEKL